MAKKPSLKNSKAVGMGEVNNVKKNMNSTSAQGFTSSTAPGLSSSNAVGSGEIENVKKKVQKSGNKNPNNKGFF